MRFIGLVLCLLLIPLFAFGQDNNEEYRYRSYQEDDFRPINVDTSLLLAPLGRVPLFDALARYNFGFVSHDRRGIDPGRHKYWLGDMEIVFNDGYPDFSLLGVLRESTTSWMVYADDALHGTPAETRYDIGPSARRGGHSLAASYSDRRYRCSVRYSGSGMLGGGWGYAVRLNRMWGRDAFIDGIFSDGVTVSLSAGKSLRDGSHIGIMVIAAPTQRSGRSWVTREAVELTGDKYYNPSWGWFDGRQRSARVYNDLTPLVASYYEFRGSDRAVFRLTAGARMGERRRSGLTWYDARNPSPDYYMNMPSYYADPEAAEAVKESWQSNPSFRQLNWTGIYEANLFSPNGPAYVLADRVERVGNTQLVFRSETVIDSNFEAAWGIRARYDRSRFFKRATDLLGSGPFPDVYQYMIDDQYYSEKRVNDIRNPRRLVAVGDKFGYDYDIVRPGVTAFGTARYRRGRWTLNSAGELSFGALWRRGHYENAVFTGDASFGRSDRYNLTTYNLGLSAVYSFSVNHRVAVCGNIQECEPETGDVFLSPECHNYGASAVNNFNLGGEIRYEGFFAGVVRIEASAYLARERRGAEILRYYDDLYADYTADNLSGYSIMTMKGVTRNMGGLEVAINVDITPRLNLRGMAAFNRYVYVGDPEVGIASDANLQSRLVGSSAKLGGYVAGDSPQTMAAVSMRYNAPSRWRLEVTLSYAGDRYVSISPVRRTQRIAFLATSPEESAAFATQERLPDAYSLNAYISKGFTLFGINFFCSLSANNILDKDIIYGGYEQNRIRKEGSGVNRTYKPFPSKYAYAYPRSFYAMLSVNF